MTIRYDGHESPLGVQPGSCVPGRIWAERHGGEAERVQRLMRVMREEGARELSVGDVRIVLGPAPAKPLTLVEDADGRLVPQPEPAPAPIGPDGKPMSEDDQMLYGATLGLPDEEAAE